MYSSLSLKRILCLYAEYMVINSVITNNVVVDFYNLVVSLQFHIPDLSYIP